MNIEDEQVIFTYGYYSTWSYILIFLFIKYLQPCGLSLLVKSLSGRIRQIALSICLFGLWFRLNEDSVNGLNFL